MPATPTSSPPLPQNNSLGRSLLSRIKTPFGSKSRNIAEFFVQPDDPVRQYSPGDTITGAVVLRVLRPVRVTHIVVCLHGYVQVYKNPNSPGDGFRAYNSSIGSGRGKRGGSYFGNGFATLFEDEVVLCGEGRLGEGTYRFNFELQFPHEQLPTSIDFERGTISYMITSIMTRPTAISPTMTHDRKVYLVENIDVAHVYQPKPRVISLEPISRRSRARTRVKKRISTGQEPQEEGSPNTSEPLPSSRVSELSSGQDESEAPCSPAPSDVSFDSGISSIGNASAIDSGPLSTKTNASGTMNDSKSSFGKKSITATIELQKAGFLRGDNIPLKISVDHVKQIKNLHGIIVTLYRQARVDMHPILPISGKSGKSRADEYYPKSKTGLGGLSLSSAGSSHLFRKDLSQSFASLIINPQTLKAEVKTAVRIPDETFPTISNVPGAMISFKYYVEVVLDLRGKFGGLDKVVSSPGIVNSPTSYGESAAIGGAAGAYGSTVPAFGGHFIDTVQIRRDKSVVACVFEIVVGTKDSERAKGKRKAEPLQEPDLMETAPQRQQEANAHQAYIGEGPRQGSQPVDTGAEPYHNHDYNHGGENNTNSYDYYYEQYPYDQSYEQPRFATIVPIPDMVNEEDLPEKERLRRAEARLLPSSPPGADAESSPNAAAYAPSAPVLPVEGDHHISSSALAPYPDDHAANGVSGPSVPPQGIVSHGIALPNSSNAPDYAPREDVDGRRTDATDDKQELQRRRLETERSAPEDYTTNEHADAADDDATAQREFAPSAPVLDEAEDYGIRGMAHEVHDLPRYER